MTPGAALLEVHLLYADGSEETIRTTDEHPFFVENWPAPDPPSIPWSEQAEERVQTPRSPRDALTWFRADQLEPGTILTTAYGPAAVEWVRFKSLRITVHNLSVANAESFLVGDDGVWVHNCEFRVPSFHSGLTQAVDWLNERGRTLTTHTIGKFGPNKGKPVGMMTADGKAGYRIEFDDRSGAHINVWSGRDPKAHVIIENANEADMFAVLRQLFPGHYP